MLLRHLSGYMIATAIQLAGSIVLLAALTRILAPEEYGRYALAIAALQIAGGPLFHWIRAIVGRFLVGSDLTGRRSHLIATVKWGIAGCSLLAVLVAGLVHSFGLLGERSEFAWAICAALVTQSTFQIQTDLHRADLRLWRCAGLLIAQSIGNVAFSLLFTALFHGGAAGALAGTTVSCLACLLVDHRHTPLRERGQGLSWSEFKPMLEYGLPLSGIMALEYLLQSGDRFIIAGLLSSEAVAAYAVPQILAARGIQNLSVVVASSSLPLIIATLERDGLAAARARYRQAGELMALALIPATTAIVALSRPIVSLLIGAELRDQADDILPIVAIATVFNAVASHYLAHGFQIARRTLFEVWMILPAAAIGMALDFALIPRFGVMGAAYALLVAQMTYFGLSFVTLKRFFPAPVPYGASFGLLLSSIAGAYAIHLLHLSDTLPGLSIGLAILTLTTALAVLVTNPGGIRSALFGRLTPC